MTSDWAIVPPDIRKQQNKTSMILRGHNFYPKFLHPEKL